MRKITKILVFALTLLTMSGCGFLKAISVQNDYASSFDVTTEPPLALGMDYEVKMSRGINDTVFYAYVPKGVQYPVASSAGRVFFQSPEGFELRVNNELRSKIVVLYKLVLTMLMIFISGISLVMNTMILQSILRSNRMGSG